MITEVNFAHPSLRGVKKLEKEEEEVEEEENIAIVQAFTCNAHVTRLFSLYGKDLYLKYIGFVLGYCD